MNAPLISLNQKKKLPVGITKMASKGICRSRVLYSTLQKIEQGLPDSIEHISFSQFKAYYGKITRGGWGVKHTCMYSDKGAMQNTKTPAGGWGGGWVRLLEGF